MYVTLNQFQYCVEWLTHKYSIHTGFVVTYILALQHSLQVLRVSTGEGSTKVSQVSWVVDHLLPSLHQLSKGLPDKQKHTPHKSQYKKATHIILSIEQDIVLNRGLNLYSLMIAL
jgi:hypothetical protein